MISLLIQIQKQVLLQNTCNHYNKIKQQQNSYILIITSSSYITKTSTMPYSNTSSQSQNNTYRQQIPNNSEKLIDIKLKFGDDGGQDQLLSLTANCFSFNSNNISQKQSQLLKQIQSKQPVSNDTLLVFKFQVQTGRQRQSIQFIQKGLDQDQSNENASAMQKLFRRPKTTGRIELKQGKGYVYVIYRLYEEMIENNINDLMKFINTKINYNFKLDIVMKGSTEPSKRSFTAVKPDYLELKLISQKLTITDFLNFIQQWQQLPQQIVSAQYYQLLKNLQIATFDLKFHSIRSIMRYYYRCLYDNEGDDYSENYNQRELPLLNKGIFKNSVTANVVLANKLAIEVEVKYKSQEVMLRLIARFMKIYENAGL